MGKCARCGKEIADETTFCIEHMFDPGTETKDWSDPPTGGGGGAWTPSDPPTGGGGGSETPSDPPTAGGGAES
ncbi:MAG: hypothetical protein M3447_10220 [Acidobacteriota bacterium]|nr:hypothetical protein [Acidobacteriota bacterium]